jgi:nicotinamide-nucleotide amidase
VDTEILTLGDEICRGEIIDTNAAFLAEKLSDLGLHVRYESSTTDDLADIEASLRLALSRARVIVVSGGLGPTEDDRTVDGAARVFERRAVVDPRALKAMEDRFAHARFRLTDNNMRQVRVLEGSQVLENRWGLAPGFMVSHEGATVVFMPGVPREMRPMFEEEALPRLRALRDQALITGQAVYVAVRHMRVFGLGESHIDHRLAGLSAGDGAGGPDGITVHYRVSYPECFVKVIVRRPGDGAAERAADTLAAEARNRLHPYVYGDEKTTFPASVGLALKGAGLTLAIAESCTGGLASSLVTDVPGSSDYFLAGYVTYANPAKEDVLGVRAVTLQEHGAVSPECVVEMAEGARRRSGARVAVAISGIAGPGGGSVDKPVGTVWFALAAEGLPTHTHMRRFAGSREQIKHISAFTALELVRRHALRLETLSP